VWRVVVVTVHFGVDEDGPVVRDKLAQQSVLCEHLGIHEQLGIGEHLGISEQLGIHEPLHLELILSILMTSHISYLL